MIKSRSKFLWVFILVLIAGGIAVWFYLNKPNRTVANEKGIEITAIQLVKDYQTNEAEANAKYLDKAIEVTGTVSQVDKNQEGKTTVMISSEDPMTSVFCTLKEDAKITAGSSITIKGFCSGMLSDVRIREAVVVK